MERGEQRRAGPVHRARAAADLGDAARPRVAAGGDADARHRPARRGAARRLLVKQFADRGVALAPEVAAFLAVRIERSFAGVAATVAALDAAALEQGREVTIPLARAVLDGQGDWLG